jgi:hypothetical protein
LAPRGLEPIAGKVGQNAEKDASNGVEKSLAAATIPHASWHGYARFLRILSGRLPPPRGRRPRNPTQRRILATTAPSRQLVLCLIYGAQSPLAEGSPASPVEPRLGLSGPLDPRLSLSKTAAVFIAQELARFIIWE